MEPKPITLGKAERRILRILQIEGRLSNVDLAERVGLSESPCLRRVRALEEAGLISGYTATIDQQRIGLQVTAFVEVSLDKQVPENKADFLAAVAQEDHIVECHAMSGSHDYLLKVVAQDIAQFSDICMERILRFPGVKDVESQLSLKILKQTNALPISIA